MNSNKVAVDIVSDIANLTGLKMDIIDLVLAAQELVILDKILENQLASEDDDIDYIEVGSLIVDYTAYPNINLRAGDQLAAKIYETVHQARDYLSESIVAKFNSELLARYANEPVEDHSPAILTGATHE